MKCFIDDSGIGDVKVYVGFLCNDDNAIQLESWWAKLIEPCKENIPNFNEFHFTDFHGGRACFNMKKITFGTETCVNNKESRFGFFSEFASLLKDCFDVGVIERVFVVTNDDFSEEESIAQTILKAIDHSINHMDDLLSKFVHYVSDFCYSSFCDDELPVEFICDNYKDRTEKEIVVHDLTEQAGNKIFFKNSDEVPLIQIADFLAFIWNRSFNVKDEPFKNDVKDLLDIYEVINGYTYNP